MFSLSHGREREKRYSEPEQQERVGRRVEAGANKMANKLKPGDKVEWGTSQGKTTGTVEKTVTSTTKIKGHVAKATTEDPQILVHSDKTGAKAVHKPDGLKKV